MLEKVQKCLFGLNIINSTRKHTYYELRTSRKSKNMFLRINFAILTFFKVFCPIFRNCLGSVHVGMQIFLFFSGRQLKFQGRQTKTHTHTKKKKKKQVGRVSGNTDIFLFRPFGHIHDFYTNTGSSQSIPALIDNEYLLKYSSRSCPLDDISFMLATLFLSHICLMDYPILINWTSPFFI